MNSCSYQAQADEYHLISSNQSGFIRKSQAQVESGC